MIDVVNKQNASILMQAIDLPLQPITMWAEVIHSLNLPGEVFFSLSLSLPSSAVLFSS